MAVTVHCLGVFRELGDSFTVEAPMQSVADLRAACDAYLTAVGRHDLVSVLKRSVFASDDLVLRDSDVEIPNAVSVLPPVAGG